MNKYIYILTGILLLGLVACKNENNTTTNKKSSKSDYSNIAVDTDSESEKFSYGMGMIIGTSLKNSGVDSIDYGIIDRAFSDKDNDQILYSITASEITRLRDEEIDMSKVNQDIIKRGIYDVLDADTSLLNIQELSQSYQSYFQNNYTRISDDNLKKGKEFLESNLNKEGVKVTDSGLQYEVVVEGTGDAPSNSDLIKVWYSAKTLGGKEFKKNTDESYTYVDLKDGFSEIPALAEAITLAPIGSEMNLYIPSNLAFGENRMSRDIGPNATLLVNISKTELAGDEETNIHRKEKEEYIKQLRQQQQQGRR